MCQFVIKWIIAITLSDLDYCGSLIIFHREWSVFLLPLLLPNNAERQVRYWKASIFKSFVWLKGSDLWRSNHRRREGRSTHSNSPDTLHEITMNYLTLDPLGNCWHRSFTSVSLTLPTYMGCREEKEEHRNQQWFTTPSRGLTNNHNKWKEHRNQQWFTTPSKGLTNNHNKWKEMVVSVGNGTKRVSQLLF